MKYPLNIQCRVCSHRWLDRIECVESPIGLLAPNDIECPRCHSRAGDPEPESGSWFVGAER